MFLNVIVAAAHEAKSVDILFSEISCFGAGEEIPMLLLLLLASSAALNSPQELRGSGGHCYSFVLSRSFPSSCLVSAEEWRIPLFVASTSPQQGSLPLLGTMVECTMCILTRDLLQGWSLHCLRSSRVRKSFLFAYIVGYLVDMHHCPGHQRAPELDPG